MWNEPYSIHRWYETSTGFGDGGFRVGCDIWPPTAATGEASIPVALPLPSHIVAQAHTHPTRCPRVRRGPKPSEGDKDAARKIDRPIFTISPNGVWRRNLIWEERRILPSNWTRGPITSKVFIYIATEPIAYIWFDEQSRVEEVFVGGS